MRGCGKLCISGDSLGRALTVGITALVLLASPAAARADQFLISTGTAFGDNSSGSMTLAGSGFTFTILGETTGQVSNLGPIFCLYPCNPAAADFTAQLSGYLGSGSAVIGVTTYSNIDFHGSMDFTGGATAITAAAGGGGYVRGPFTFAGLFNGFQEGTQVFSHTLTGRGQGQLYFSAGNANDSTLLTFEDAAPTPEPATLLLLATGAAGIAARRRRPTR